MKHRFVFAALAAALLLPGAGLSLADDGEEEIRRSKAPVDQKAIEGHRKNVAAKREATAREAAKIKPVDINGASKAELKKLPGIGDAEADKIVAGRPYNSKFRLVTDKIIPEGIFQGIRTRIVAKQPQFKDAAEVAKAYGNGK